MISNNWLLSYATVPGIGNILNQMNVRTRGKSRMNLATVELNEHYAEFKEEFTSFFPDLIKHTENKLKEL